MQRYAVLATLLICAIYAQAEPWRPFLGVGAAMNNTDDHYLSYTSNHYAALMLPNHSGLSVQVEGGLTKSTYSVYAGYRTGSASYSDSRLYEIWGPGLETVKYKQSDITSQHFVLGGRVQPILKFMPEYLRPLLGLGVSYGKAKREMKWDDTYVWTFFPDTTFRTESFSESVESDDYWGGIMQMGLSFRPSKLPMQIYAMFEIHAYQTRFENVRIYSPTADQYEIRENGAKIGLIYYFGKLGEEE